ncbi:MAG: prephenate dehydrogenase/arogenate dehydrogenase family protein [Nitrospiraceae bacterium]|nr:MAG: prephenate dehydrogenase/arogenate dehydrogenase family protein [Nitrospiraceae bacterium]
MDFNKITIIGIGLIGSSLALALKKQGFSGKMTGVGRNQENLIKAKEMGIIDDYSTSHAEGVIDADLIVLASTVGQFEEIVKNIRDHIKKGAILTDVGSVKAGVIKKIRPLMPEGVSFVGGHPIAGKECSGIHAATADLFNGAKCIITPEEDTDNEALDKVIGVWKKTGAVTAIMSPEEHDLVFAAVSHLPHVVAYALVNAILDVDDNILRHGGRGLKDMTRIALSPTELWRDICSYNRDDILITLRKFSSSITHIINLFEEAEWDTLEKEFTRAKEARQGIEPA